MSTAACANWVHEIKLRGSVIQSLNNWGLQVTFTQEKPFRVISGKLSTFQGKTVGLRTKRMRHQGQNLFHCGITVENLPKKMVISVPFRAKYLTKCF